MEVKVLGSGCKNCKTLEVRTEEALELEGLDAAIEKVTDFGAIASWGVMSTPALVIDGEVVVAGRVPSVQDLRSILTAQKP